MFQTNEEYLATLERYFDSLRNKKISPSDADDCNGVSCPDCIFHGNKLECLSTRAFESLEALYNWAKEHPVITYAKKYEEIFGIDPTEYCPMDFIGMPSGEECRELRCAECKEIYWNKEYKELTKGE